MQPTNSQEAAERDYWNQHAARDPLWAILSDHSRRDRGWNLQAFMETGEREIALLLRQVHSLGIEVPRGRALDFGCGVGRLSQAMGRRFASVVGLDISPEMIRLAQAINKYSDTVEYQVSALETLSRFGATFDFAYSNLVLQHMDPVIARDCIAQLVRTLKPGGLLVFQLPSTRAEAGHGPAPMPDPAYRCQLTIIDGLPSRFEASSTLRVVVSVQNASPLQWSQGDVGVIRLGNHWRTRSGEMVVQDDGQSALRPTLDAGESCEASLEVTRPIRSRRVPVRA